MANPADISLRKLPPYLEEAEQYVLGACLFAPDAISRALESLEESDFYKTAHRKLFSTMCRLFEADQPIDVLTLAEALRKENELDAVGGLDYLDFLEGLVPTSAAITHHAKIVREKRILRDLIETATEIVTHSYDDTEEAEVILDRAEQAIFQISERKTKRSFFSIKEIVKSNFDAIEKLFENPGTVTGLESGFKDLDQLTSGFQPSIRSAFSTRKSMCEPEVDFTAPPASTFRSSRVSLRSTISRRSPVSPLAAAPRFPTGWRNASRAWTTTRRPASSLRPRSQRSRCSIWSIEASPTSTSTR